MDPPSPVDQMAARDWLKSLHVVAPPEDQIANVLKQWRIWRAATPAAREANLALELKALAPAEEVPGVISLNRRLDLQALSRANLARLKEKISDRLPLNEAPSAETEAQVQSLTGDLNFHYLRANRENSQTGVHPPLASSRELARLGLDFAPAFYSHLIGRSPSVPFTVVAANGRLGPFDALRLNDELAREAGFVLPNFASPRALLEFFAVWEPELIEKVRRQNRMSLPAQVSDAQEFMDYLDSARSKEVFPDESAFDRLSLLRERLISYVLTEPDAKELLQWAFKRWLLTVAQNEPEEFRRFTAVTPVFAKKFLPALGLTDLSVRVPLAVGPQWYSILRIEKPVDSHFPGLGRSRRLDHDSKP